MTSPASLRYSRRAFLLATAAIPASRTAAASAPLTRDEADAADRVRTKVIVLKIARENRTAAATGFLARPGIVITAAHAVRTPGSVSAWVNGVRYPAQVLALHPEFDLAALLLAAPELQLKPVELAESTEALASGEALIVMTGPSQGAKAKGDPADRVALPARFRRRLRQRLPTGTISPMLELDGYVRLGDSGSPIVRVRDARVVGVLSSRELPDDSGISQRCYAVPGETIQSWLDSVYQPDSDEVFYLERAAGR